ncbi:MAG TPA: superoxide dismutase family protein [Gemmatimonadales bacterium]|nr:superoxide dismutase family protein [Gemmatimonadales bacterium]
MRTILSITACAFALTACSTDAGRDMMPDDTTTPGGMTADDAPAGATASATMMDASGRELGTLALADAATGITLTGTLTGLPPGEHAIHVHTVGACEVPFTSAGGHWNPTDSEHGTQNPNGPHFGDMLNVTVAADSTVSVQRDTPGGMLEGENALLDADGASVVVHAGPDDNVTDPAGNAGDRIACGVITRD